MQQLQRTTREVKPGLDNRWVTEQEPKQDLNRKKPETLYSLSPGSEKIGREKKKKLNRTKEEYCSRGGTSPKLDIFFVCCL